jgi:hypothetical protein
MSVGGMFRPGMRAYTVPLVAGAALAASAFLPWVNVSGEVIRGYPDTMSLWVIGLGCFASVLAVLSLITRKNSRHPLLVVGLVALGIMLLSWRIMPMAAGERALTVSQAIGIVDDTPMVTASDAAAGYGIYVGLAASIVIVGFGLTIIFKRVARPYVVVDPDDDV